MNIISRGSRGKQITEISWGEVIGTLLHQVNLLFRPSNQRVVPTKGIKKLSGTRITSDCFVKNRFVSQSNTG